MRESVLAVLREWDEPFILLAEITDVETNAIHVRELFGEFLDLLKMNKVDDQGGEIRSHRFSHPRRAI